MKKLLSFLTLLLLMCAAARADAGCPTLSYQRTYQQTYYPLTYSYAQAYNYTPTYVAAIVDPGYRGYYNANYDAEQALRKDYIELAKAQKELIRLQQQSIEQLRLGQKQDPGDPTGNPAQVTSFEAFANQRCLKCHQDGTEEVKRTKFIMFEKDGKLSPFSFPEKERMKWHVLNGTMPPGSTIPASERKAASLSLNAQK